MKRFIEFINEEGEGAPANNIAATPGIDQPPILLGKQKKIIRRPQPPEPPKGIVRIPNSSV